MAKIKDVISFLESRASPQLQESYDNSGLITGDRESDITGVLVSLDCTEEVVDEAIVREANLIVCHHPIVFKGLKSLTGENYVERTVIKAIKNNIAIYAIHTNLDNVISGVNGKIAELLELTASRVLQPREGSLLKVVVFTPESHKAKIIKALSEAGAGIIGNYEGCSFSTSGFGTFIGNEGSNPTVGSKGSQEEIREERIEMIFPRWSRNAIVRELVNSHPYEEPAYYIHETLNTDSRFGSGIIGNLSKTLRPEEFLQYLKDKLNLSIVRYTSFSKSVSKVAVCGGSGSFLLKSAVKAKADAFVTGDFKYHEFFDAEGKLMICDVGHYESEAFTKELIYDLIMGEFNSFAVNLSNTNTNPVNYFY